MPDRSTQSTSRAMVASLLPTCATPWVVSFVGKHGDLEVDVDPHGRWGAATAVFAPGREHRYLLTRIWDPTRPTVIFVMLNPSTADAFDLDPTVRRCAGFSQSWGAGSLIVANIFALRSTNPKGLYTHSDPVGPLNDEVLATLPNCSSTLVAAWGTRGAFRSRGEVARQLLARPNGPELKCLGTTKKGFPRHPLFVPGATVPARYE